MFLSLPCFALALPLAVTFVSLFTHTWPPPTLQQGPAVRLLSGLPYQLHQLVRAGRDGPGSSLRDRCLPWSLYASASDALTAFLRVAHTSSRTSSLCPCSLYGSGNPDGTSRGIYMDGTGRCQLCPSGCAVCHVAKGGVVCDQCSMQYTRVGNDCQR